ncbi:ubiquinone biosynthesis protein COQ4 homolog, mitochondrial-like [Haliotis rufescens]|uniref:ubiquinone biosynthesis protein COQ4 homolog, mitochondrial-like n=1 Tax=Haliotis rufescens TaxID=6454 RepID=UPI001EB02CAA|nr:ubiquinone biosynthesis protein COQ4 homolog, mitochondrial-like [Haliotis rufescens]
MASCWRFRPLVNLTYSKYMCQRRMQKNIFCQQSQVIIRRLKATYSTENLDEDRQTDDSYEDKGRQLHYDDLYPGHIPTSLFQKAVLAVGSAAMCIINPARDDMICALGETTGPIALRYMRQKMLADPVGRQILEEEPLITTETISVPYLKSLPDNTFGKAYWRFLDKNGFSPDARRPVNFVDDRDLMYVMLRYRQLHDLMHTLLGMPPNMLGEVVVKWFEAIQTGLPMCAVGALVGPVRLGPKHRQKYLSIYLPWVLRSANNSKFLMSVYFEKHFEKDLDEFRKELNLEPAPVPLIKTGAGTVTK